MSEVELQKQLDRKELELNALLEITQAINSNVPEESLYKMYNFTLRSNLRIRKLALYVFDEVWRCQVNFGTKTNFLKYSLDDRFHLIKQVHRLTEFESECDFHQFDLVIPVAHQSETLAVVFIGGLESNNLNHDYEDSIKFVHALSNIIIVAIENK